MPVHSPYHASSAANGRHSLCFLDFLFLHSRIHEVLFFQLDDLATGSGRQPRTVSVVKGEVRATESYLPPSNLTSYLSACTAAFGACARFDLG